MNRLYDEHDRRLSVGGPAREERLRSAAAPGRGNGSMLMPSRLLLLAIVLAVIGYIQLRDRLSLPGAVASTDTPAYLMDSIKAPFALCGSGSSQNCVADGGSIVLRGAVVMLDDVSVPRAIGSACPAEHAIGIKAAARLRALLSDGAFDIDRAMTGNDTPGRFHARLTRDGMSIGQMLVSEGLARHPGAGGWCA
ncbi:MAG: hypothetical protein DI547_04750 [Sphingobium sp.]|jgi:endonuclease YncB( thermonuclease family)|nr:MAG: hypothetical protein DI547_04750 [Sphingobium sp.]